MNHQNFTHRSFHSLKNSVVFNANSIAYLNSSTPRPGASLNSKQDDSNSQKPAETKPLKQSTPLNPKNQPYLSLGSKRKQPRKTPFQQDPPRITQLSTKLNKMQQILQSQQQRINILQDDFRYKNSNNLQKQEILTLINNCYIENSKRIPQLQSKVISQIQAMKKDMQGVGNYEKRIQSVQAIMRQSLISTKNIMYHELKEMEKKLAKNIKKDLEIFTYEMKQDLAYLMKKVSAAEENQTLVSTASTMISKFKPMFNDSTLRIKFSNSVSLVSLFKQNTDNPQLNPNPHSRTFPLQNEAVLYKIDEEGFLLDENNHYIVNNRNEHIQLSMEQVKLLEQWKMIGGNICEE